MIFVRVSLFASALIISLALTPLFRKIFLRLNIVDTPGERKLHEKTIPYGGGPAIFLATLIPISICFILAGFANTFGKSIIPREIYIHIDGIFNRVFSLIYIFTGGAILVTTGIIDDKKNLSAKVKFLIQAIVISALVILNKDIRATVFIDNSFITCLITIIWILGITNAFNLLDNMDGLSAGCALIASLLFFIITMQAGQIFVSSAILVFAGALSGFLKYNRAPASVYMGDAGSTFIGYFLSIMTILSTYYHQGTNTGLPVLMPLIILSVPLFDTFSVMYIRIKNKKPIYVGDNNHLSHRLVKLGMTNNEAVVTIYLLTFCVGLASLLLPRLDILGSILIFAQVIVIFSIVLLLENAGKRK